MSTAPALPPGWKNWPEDKLEELLAGLEALANDRAAGKGPWLCGVPDCDGMPHPGRRNRHSRAEQRAPADPDWDYWALFAGRGFGKTRTGAEWVIDQARTFERGALVGPTAADVRDIMVEGESGILACARRSFRPEYQPSKRRLVYPNGAIQVCYSADEPDRLRGPQHHYGWADELAAWRYYRYAWDMLMMGMRLGLHPRICITTTPRPLDLIKELNKDERCRVVKGSTYANLTNLAPTFARTVLDRYAGTTLGRQELDAEILEDIPGALVRRRHIDAARVETAPVTDMIVIGVDPAGTGTGDEAGIVVVGREAPQHDDEGAVTNAATVGHSYVLADLSGQLTARQTGIRAWQALYEYGAQALVYEDNFGKQWLRDGLIDAFADYHGLSVAERQRVIDAGEWTEDMREMALVRDDATGPLPNPWKYLRKVTAQHGKELRAQPVAMRYEQGRVHHVGQFDKLEDQLCLVAGAQIETRRGLVAIECVTEGDEVMTRSGWAPVAWSGQTGTADVLVGLHVEDCALWMTPGHPVWDANQGRFVRADSVGTGFRPDVRRSAERMANRLRGPVDGGIGQYRATTVTPGESSCTGLSGKHTTGPLVPMSWSTTSTTTKATIRSGIFAQSQQPNTGQSTRHSVAHSPRTDGNDQCGAGLNGSAGSHEMSPVLSAGRSTSPLDSGRSTAPVSVPVKLSTPVPVYNLMVSDGYPPEYYANGVLVHNCTWNPHSDKLKEKDSPDRIDALVHAVTYLLKRERAKGTFTTPHAAGIGRARGAAPGHPLLRGRR